MVSNLYCRKHQFILQRVFLLSAVNYVEINCLIICHFHKRCHIRGTIFTLGLLPTLPLQRSHGDATESFMGEEVLWAPEQRRWREDNNCLSFCFYVFVFMPFPFRVCQFAVPRLGKKRISFPWGSIWTTPGENYMDGCLGNMDRLNPFCWYRYVVFNCCFLWNRQGLQ